MEVELVRDIVDALCLGQDIAIIRIIGRSGSAPRDVGSACVVHEDGSLVGSVGGGYLEHRVVVFAREKLQSGADGAWTFALSRDEMDREKMICGLDVTFFVETVRATDSETRNIFQAIFDSLEAGKVDIALLTEIPADKGLNISPGKLLMIDGKKVLGTLDETFTHGTEDGFALIDEGDEQCRYICERFTVQPEVVIWGGGHVGIAIAKLARDVGFRAVVVDDREEITAKVDPTCVDEIYNGPFTPESVARYVSAHSYVVIVTRSPVHDSDILQAVLGLEQQPVYLGMVGSRRKKKIIEEKMVKAGVEQQKLNRLHLPIGLEIYAESPAEIAVSIIAEMIAHKNAPI